VLADAQPDRSRDDEGSLTDEDGFRANGGFRLKNEEAGSKPQVSLAPVLHMRADLPSLSASYVSASASSSKQVRLEPWAG
jgi:hypothetical protein